MKRARETEELHILLRERFGLELDELAAARADELVQRQKEAGRLHAWLGIVREGPPDAVPVRALLATVTNGQTYFMRDPAQLRALQAWLVARQRSLQRPMHVWSAGCSTGEETYTLALLGLSAGLRLRITGSDVNPQAVEQARRGVYAEWSLRHLTALERATYLEPAGGAFSVKPRVREHVSFCVHNLAASEPLTPPGAERGWDAILCRNVLIYFAEAVRMRVLAELEGALLADGALVLSSSEWLRGARTQLLARNIDGGFIFVREVAPPVRSEAPRPTSSAPPRLLADEAEPPRSRKAAAPSSHPPETEDFAARASLRERLDAGSHCLRRHLFEAALEHYARAREQDGLCAEAYVLEAIVHLKRGALDEARADLRSALFLDPRLWCAEYMLAGIHGREGKLQEQARCLARAESLLMAPGPAPQLLSDTSGIEPLCYTRGQALSLCRARLGSLRKGDAT